MATAAELAILLTVKDMASKQLEGFGKSVGGMGAAGKVAAVGLAGVAAAGLGLVAGIGAAVGEAMDFESAMSAVAAVAGGTDADLKRLSDTALQLGQDTTLSGVGATEAAQAMRELAAAGLSVDDIVGGAALGALRLASAGGIDVARAAEIASMALANFGLEGKDTARVADLFAAAANSSAISVDDIAEAMKYVGPVANSMGLSIEDVTATIAALGNQGIKGTQAGTALRSMMVSLAKPSKEANKIIKQLGLSFFDAGGEMKDLGGIAEELKTGMAGLSDQQRAAALATLFGNEALTAATVLYGEGAAGIADWLGKVTEGATAAEVGAKRNANLKGSLEALKSSAETAMIAFGMGLTPALQDLAKSFADGVSAAIPFLTALGARLGAALRAGIGVLQQFGGYVAGVVTALVDAWRKLQAGEITLAQFIGGLKNLATAVLADVGGLLGRFGEVLGPFLATVLGGIRAALPIVGAELVKLGQAFGGWVAGTAVPYLQQQLPQWLGALAGWLTGTALPAVASAAAQLATALSGWVTATAIPFLQANLPAWGAALWDWITAVAVPTVTGRVVALATALADWVTTQAVPFLQAKLPVWGEAIWGYITGVAVPTVTGQVVGLANALSEWLRTEAAPRVQANMPAWVAAITAGIEGANTAADSGIARLADTFGNWVGAKVIPALTADLGKTALLMAAWFPTVLVAATRFTADLGQEIGKWFGSPQQAQLRANLLRFYEEISTWMLRMTFLLPILALKLGAATGEAIAKALESKIPDIQATIARIGTAITSGIAIIIPLVFPMAGAIGAAIVDGIIGGLAGGVGRVVGAARNLALSALQAARNALESKSPSKKFIEVGHDVVAGFVQGLDERQQDAAKKAAEVASAVAKAVTDTLGALRALAGFDFATDAPTGDDLGWFAALTRDLLTTLEAVAADFEAEALAHVEKFSDALGKVGAAIKGAVEGLLALGKADWARSSPTGSAIGWFVHLATSLVASFADAAARFADGALDEAQAFADAAGKVGGSVKSALEGLQALAKADWAESSPTGSALGWFTHLIGSLVANFARAGAGFEEGALQAASDFADTAGKVGGSVKSGVEGLAALAQADWAETSPSGSAMAWFTHLLASLTQNFAAAAREFEEGALAAARDFADSAGKVAGTIGPAVQGFAALSSMTAPSPVAIDALVAGVKYLVGKFREAAKMMDAEGTKATADFSDAAGKALGAAKTGVELFAAMAGDKDKAGNRVAIQPPSAQAIDDLMAAIRYVIGKFREMATSMEHEGIKQMQEFAGAAGQVLEAAKRGTDLFASMEKLAVPSEKAIDYLLGSIGYVITQTRAIATGIGTEGMAQAQSFATGALNVFTTIKAALELFKELDQYKDIPTKALDRLHTDLEDALDWARKLFQRSEAIKADALAFAANMREAARAIAEGMSLGQGLPSGSALAAPAALGAGPTVPGAGGTVKNYYISTGDVYDGQRFEDRVVSAIDTADRRGR